MKLQVPGMEDVGFQMAPMIDIVFQLMIFFMCASNLHLTLDNPPIAVPIAENSSVPEELSDRRYITVTADGTILMGGEKVSLAILGREVAKAKEKMPSLKITVRGDAKAKHKYVRDAMKVCADAGAGEILFATYENASGS